MKKNPLTASTLHERRRAAGLSKERLAQKAGISARTIYAIENNEVSPHPSTLRVLEKALESCGIYSYGCLSAADRGETSEPVQ